MSNCQSLNTKKTPLIGAHMPISGGVEKSLEIAETLKCSAIQIFTKSNRQWHAKPFSQKQIDLFKKTHADSSVLSITAHASYLINLGSSNEDLVDKSITSLHQELTRCDQLNIKTLVLHPGSNNTLSKTSTAKKIGENINRAFETYSGTCTLALENMAGQGATIGTTFEELAEILSHVEQKNKLGFCFDTCHAFAAGYKFDTTQEHQTLWNCFDRTLGINKLRIIHFNNSKTECNSRVDRHDHLDMGKISLEAFQLILNNEAFDHIPKILETPKEGGFIADQKNLEIIKKLLKR